MSGNFPCSFIAGLYRHIDIDDIKYLTPREVSNVFKEKPDKDMLKARSKNCVFYWDKKGMEAVHSKEADKIKETLLGTTDLSDIDDFRGLTACLGRATGTVKVVKSATEIDKVNGPSPVRLTNKCIESPGQILPPP